MPGRAADTPRAPILHEDALAMPLRTILVADSDPDTREILRVYLESLGVTVHVHDGVSCAHATRRLKPDVVVIGLSRRYGDGLRTVRRLTSNPRTATVPVVVFTATAVPEILDRARAAGSVLALPKPMSPLELVERIEAALEAYRGLPLS